MQNIPSIRVIVNEMYALLCETISIYQKLILRVVAQNRNGWFLSWTQDSTK